MRDRVPRTDYPWWVKLSMWGVPGRWGLWMFVAICIALAIGSIVYAMIWDPRYVAGSLFLFGALMYWLSIRWVDRYGSWDGDDTPEINKEEW